MSNLYTVTKQIHETIQDKAKKYGLENPFTLLLDEFDKIMPLTEDIYEEYAITENEIIEKLPNQIRQTLLAFKNVLGENPEYTKYENKAQFHYFVTLQKNYADALCNKWLDSLTPMFATNPETVLTELLEILKTL
jgi:hypothetical protein